MIIIGLTGMSGSGKTYVAALFKDYGIPSINADSIVHELYSGDNACTQLLKSRFGAQVLRSDHSVDRKALGEIVFADKKQLSLLNQTVHGFVIEKIREQLNIFQEEGTRAVLIDAPQLFESRLDNDCDYIITVIADCETRIERIMKRDAVSREVAEQRLSHQLSDSFFQERADFVIDNSGGNDLLSQIHTILSQIGLYL